MIGTHASNAVGVGSIPSWGIKIPHAAPRQKKKKTKKTTPLGGGQGQKEKVTSGVCVCVCGVEEWSEN